VEARERPVRSSTPRAKSKPRAAAKPRALPARPAAKAKPRPRRQPEPKLRPVARPEATVERPARPAATTRPRPALVEHVRVSAPPASPTAKTSDTLAGLPRLHALALLAAVVLGGILFVAATLPGWALPATRSAALIEPWRVHVAVTGLWMLTAGGVLLLLAKGV
jgi:hypothetical protein